MDDKGIKVGEATMRRWAAVAMKIRTADVLVQAITVPVEGSSFAVTDDMYPSESSSQWAREPLRSAVDHLTTWANHAIPLEQYEGQVVVHQGFRWTFTLVRAALEGAAQSMWLTQAASPQECVARLIRSVRHDISEEAKAWAALGRDSAALKERANRHAERAELWKEWGKPAPKLPAMVDLIRMSATYEDLDPNAVESMWRVCGAAAHGKDWAIRELQVFSAVREWRPGQYHFTGYPDAEKLTGMLEDATDFLDRATIRYLIRMGADVGRELKDALITAAERTPSTDNGELVRAMREKFNSDFGSDR